MPKSDLKNILLSIGITVCVGDSVRVLSDSELALVSSTKRHKDTQRVMSHIGRIINIDTSQALKVGCKWEGLIGGHNYISYNAGVRDEWWVSEREIIPVDCYVSSEGEIFRMARK